MENSLLATLPGELRNRIWRFTCVETDAITVDKNPTRLPGLLFTCSQIREESHSIYFAENTFRVSASFYNATWFQKIGFDATRLIRGVEISQPNVADARALATLSYEPSMLFMRENRHAQYMLQKQVGYLMVFLKKSGLHPNAVQVPTPTTKQGWCDAAWTLVKEAQDSKLVGLRNAAREGEDALGIKLTELPEDLYDEVASDDELTELSEGSSSGDDDGEDEDANDEYAEDEDPEVIRCGGRGVSRGQSP